MLLVKIKQQDLLRDGKKFLINPIHAGISKTRPGRGAESAPLLTPLFFIRTKPNFVWANTIL